MAGFKGSSKIISSSYLYTQLQALYTKIKGLIDKKADKIHTHSEYQNNIKIHEKIDLKSGTFLSCITEQINKGYRGGKIEINNYCPEDTCNDNHWGMVEWTCNENQFIHMFFYIDRWEVIYVRECCVAENNDTGWHKIGDGCNADTLDGYHDYDFLHKTSVVTIPNNGSDNVEGGELQLVNQNGEAWCIDSIENSFRVYRPNDVRLLFHQNGSNSFYGDSYFTNNIHIGDATFHTDGNIYLPNNAWSYMKNCYLYDVLNNLNARVNSLPITGYGENGLTYYQTNGDFEGNSDWCHYIIANHGNGETYYHYNIALPFWSSPMYQRQTGNTSAKSGWQKFHTTETITKGTWGLTPGVSSLANDHIYIQYE